MSNKFNVGDRVRGLFSHRGKEGTVFEVPNKHWVVLMWDGGRRKSTVEAGRLVLIGSDRNDYEAQID